MLAADIATVGVGPHIVAIGAHFDRQMDDEKKRLGVVVVVVVVPS